MASSNLTKIDQTMLGAAEMVYRDKGDDDISTGLNVADIDETTGQTSSMVHRLADRGHRQALLLRIEQEGMRAVLSGLMIEHEPIIYSANQTFSE